MSTMPFSRSKLSLALAAVLLLGGCAAPVKPDGAGAARNAIVALKSDAKLAAQVPIALLEAELAVQAAEVPTRDLLAGQHAAHVAQRKVAIARAEAERQIADAALKNLKQQREAILREAQSRELEIARAQADAAATAVLAQQQAALLAQEQAIAARLQNEALRQELELLHARPTDRGMVMTMGDVLFAPGKAELQVVAIERLDKLAGFMHRYPDQTLLIEGHSDALGNEETPALSLRRAEAVKVHLIIQSVDAARITTVTRGGSVPVADNASAEGRQDNRRVEIIISNGAVMQ